MVFDFYAKLDASNESPKNLSLPCDLVSGFVDICTIDSLKTERKGKSQADAQERYRKHVETRRRELKLPECLGLDAQFNNLPDPDWIAFEVCFKLKTPWYSKDDRTFHVLHNPVRKDRVFGVPFMSAASWKGLLRWACQMQECLKRRNKSFAECKDHLWIPHLFGNEKNEDAHFQSGALAFRPTWFSKICFEVINPHSRKTRAGTMPIYYEVVPAGTSGQLRFLYAPLPGTAARDEVEPSKALCKLLCATHALLGTYGISAKRTAGWGTAKIKAWKAWRKDTPTAHPIEGHNRQELLQQLFPSPGNGP